MLRTIDQHITNIDRRDTEAYKYIVHRILLGTDYGKFIQRCKHKGCKRIYISQRVNGIKNSWFYYSNYDVTLDILNNVFLKLPALEYCPEHNRRKL